MYHVPCSHHETCGICHVSGPCPHSTAAFTAKLRSPVVRTLRELHPVRCDCSRCCPWIPALATTGGAPHQTLYVSLAEDEAPPEGWRFPGGGIL